MEFFGFAFMKLAEINIRAPPERGCNDLRTERTGYELREPCPSVLLERLSRTQITAKKKGRPGWPEFDFATTSAARVLIVAMAAASEGYTRQLSRVMKG